MPYKNKNYQRKYLKEYWQENKDRYDQSQLIQLGTSNFSEHRLKDFDKEYEAIQKEKQRIQQQNKLPIYHTSWINDNREIVDTLSIMHKHAWISNV